MTERASMLCYVPPGRVATDAEPGLERLLREAPARLTLISVVPRAPEWITSRLPGGAQLEALAVEHQRQVLQRLSDGLAREELDCRRLVLVGDPVEVLLAALEDGGHDQLVLDEPTAAEGGLGRELLRRSPVPVRVLGPDGPRHGRVVVAVDPRLEADHQRRLIRLARERARRDGAQLSIVHTWEVLAGHLLASRQSREAHQALLDARRSAHRWALARLVDSIPGALPDERLELLEGHHGPALEADLQRRPADLLVLGSAGRRGVLGWLRGNTAERLLGTARTELLVVPGVDDAITPLPLPATPARGGGGGGPPPPPPRAGASPAAPAVGREPVSRSSAGADGLAGGPTGWRGCPARGPCWPGPGPPATLTGGAASEPADRRRPPPGPVPPDPARRTRRASECP